MTDKCDFQVGKTCELGGDCIYAGSYEECISRKYAICDSCQSWMGDNECGLCLKPEEEEEDG